MKETQKLYHSISDIDQRFLREAQTAKRRKPGWRWAALAACLCLVAACAIAAFLPWGESRGTPAPGPGGAVLQGTEKPSTAPEPTQDAPSQPSIGTPVSLTFNDLDASPAVVLETVHLAAEDFHPMGAEESFQYFGVDFREDVLSGLGFEHTGGGCWGNTYGVYQQEKDGVYFDTNTYRFTNGHKSVTLTMRTAFQNLLPSPELVKKGPEKLQFTQIAGWELVLFRYPGEDGAECLYTEFAQNGVVFTVTACGLESGELASALAGFLPQKEIISEPRTAAGTVTHVDSRKEDFFDGVQHQYTESHDYITLDCGGYSLTVWLPGEAGRFQVGDRVTVTYQGEPATAYNIWPGQRIRVE